MINFFFKWAQIKVDKLSHLISVAFGNMFNEHCSYYILFHNFTLNWKAFILHVEDKIFSFFPCIYSNTFYLLQWNELKHVNELFLVFFIFQTNTLSSSCIVKSSKNRISDFFTLPLTKNKWILEDKSILIYPSNIKIYIIHNIRLSEKSFLFLL